MKLKHRYENEDDIPEQHRELFTEAKDGGWECTGILGMKTQADVDRMQVGLTKEREAHTAAKEKIAAYEALGTVEEVQTELDRIPVLEAAQEGAGDDKEKFDAAVEKAVAARVAAEKAPLERDKKKLETERDTLKTENEGLTTYKSSREMEDAVRPVMMKLGIDPDHHDDVMMWAERHLERIEGADGKAMFVSKGDIDGIVAGSDPHAWLEQMIPRKKGWLPPDESGNARGSVAGGAPAGKNPWKEGGTLDEKAAYMEKYGMDAAEKAAKRAGTTLGGVPQAESSI